VGESQDPAGAVAPASGRRPTPALLPRIISQQLRPSVRITESYPLNAMRSS